MQDTTDAEDTMALESESMEETVRTTIHIKLGCSMPIPRQTSGVCICG